MAAKLFETQPQWGEKQDSQAALFRTFAEELELGLDTAWINRTGGPYPDYFEAPNHIVTALPELIPAIADKV